MSAVDKWKVSVHPLCAGQYAVSRKIGEVREFRKTPFGAGAVPMIESYSTRDQAQAVADNENNKHEGASHD